MMTLQSKTLRQHRRSLDLNQDDVANTLGVTSAFISNIERGRSNVPVKRFKEVCDAYQISADALASAIKKDRDAVRKESDMEFDRIVEKARECAKALVKAG